ncbi:MAG: TetR/AcrR family transcriptional regulator [Ruminococcus sp.]|nr:TetR/AcrR family transcriptional regulator [Ruminococcus sp.]
MAEKKPNRRALKTRKAIFEGLAELLCEKELPRITVNELTEKADIHRATFYKHFLDIYDVYEKLEMTILSDIGLIMTSHDGKAPLALYTDILTYVKAHPQYFGMICSPHNTSGLYQKLLKMFIGVKRMITQERLHTEQLDSAALSVIRYHANGCFAVIADWVLHDFGQPEEFIIRTLSGLDESAHAYLQKMIRS